MEKPQHFFTFCAIDKILAPFYNVKLCRYFVCANHDSDLPLRDVVLIPISFGCWAARCSRWEIEVALFICCL